MFDKIVAKAKLVWANLTSNDAETKRGRGEARWAIVGWLLVTILLAIAVSFLTGCAGGQVYGKYSHRSSIPDYYDRNTSDVFGVCVEIKICESCGEYSPSTVGCVNVETTDKPVYGRDPIGELEIKFPVKVW